MFLGWDGGDCCIDTCVALDGTACTNLVASDCVSPAETGSEILPGKACPFEGAAALRFLDGYSHQVDHNDIRDREHGTSRDCMPAWPYHTSFAIREDVDRELGYHIKLPFVAYAAFRNVVQASSNFTDVAHSAVPSILCGDCQLRHLRGEYWSHLFRVETNSTTQHPIFPKDLDLKRRRYYPTPPNMVLVGPLLTTQRYKLEHCDAGDSLFSDSPSLDCVMDQTPKNPFAYALWEISGKRFKKYRHDKSPFGTDATFLESSSLYRATNAASDYYAEEEIGAGGLPYGFFETQGSISANSTAQNKHVRGFPVVLDVNLNVSRYRDIIQLLKDGGYIDERTRHLRFQLLLFNAETADIGLVETVVTKLDGGGYGVEWDISIIDAVLYESKNDWLRCLGELTYVGCLGWCIVSEIFEMLKAQRSPAGFLRGYWLDWKNLIDCVSYSVQFLLVIAWGKHALKCGRLRLETNIDGIVRDFFAVGRVLEAGKGMSRAIKMYDDIADVVQSGKLYLTLVGISIFVSIIQFLKCLHFHPRLGLTTSTLFAAGRDLLLFALLFAFILVIYGILGLLLFGQRLPSFQGLGNALMSLIDISLGDFGSTAESKQVGNVVAVLFFYSFVVLSSLILLNALLAIILNASSKVHLPQNCSACRICLHSRR